MQYEDARELAHQVNPAMVGAGDGPLARTYTEAVERGTLEWDHLELDSGGTVLEAALRGESPTDRW